jgi:branched-chain amino acid transport system substrate-binding protein
MKKKALLTLFFCVGFVLALVMQVLPTGCKQAIAKTEPIRMGAIVPMTGFFSQYGPACRAGLELRFEEAGYKVAGKPIKLIFEDSGTDAATALDKAKKLVELNKVRIVFGPLHSGVSQGVVLYLSKKKVPDVAFKHHPIEWRDQDWLFVTQGSLWQNTYPIGHYAYDVLGYKEATTIGTDYVAGYKFVGGFIDGFEEKGGTITKKQWSPLGTADYGSYLAALGKAEVCAYWLGGTIDSVRFLTQYRDFGLFDKMPVILPYAEDLPEEFLSKIGPKVLGMLGGVSWVPRLDTPMNKKFVPAIIAKTGKKPDAFTMSGYEAASIALAALEATGGDTTPEKLRRAILGLKLETPCGPVSFTPEGYAIRDYTIVQAKMVDGEYAWVPIYTYHGITHPKKWWPKK